MNGPVVLSGPETQVSPVDTTRYTTTAVAMDPTNHDTLVASANALKYPARIATFSTAGRGGPWTSSVLPQPASAPNQFSHYPAPVFDTRGELYESYMPFASTAGGLDSQLVIARSTDKGLDWNSPVVIEPVASGAEKPLMAVDATTGPYRNRLYVAYDTNPSPDSEPLMVAHSDDGRSWTKTRVFDSGGDYGGAPVVGANGDVYVAWNDWCYPLSARDCAAGRGVMFGRLLIARSSDGGQSFGPPVQAATLDMGFGVSIASSSAGCNNQPALVLPGPELAIDNSGGPHQGTLYMAYTDRNPNVAYFHVWLIRSTDGGATWSIPWQLDSTNQSGDSWNAALAIDQTTGAVTAAWSDRRGYEPKLYRIYYTQSTDGGATFLPSELAVSSVASDPTLSCTGTGDYMQMVSADGVAHPFWVDTRNGWSQIFTSPINEAAVAQVMGRPSLLFQPPTSVTAIANANLIFSGDFTGNHVVDLVVAATNPIIAGPETISVSPGRGDGTFGSPITTSITGNVNSIAVADFDRDGKPDLALMGVTPANGGYQVVVTTLLNQGNGSFRTVTSSPSLGVSGVLATADFNGDGIPDLVVADGQTVTVLLGNGDGTFRLGGSAKLSLGSVAAMAVGDLNGDGKQDVVIAEQFGITVVLGNGDGTLQTPVLYIDQGQHQPSGVVLGDFNHDGKLDIAVANFYYTAVSIFLGNGDGTFQTPIDYGDVFTSHPGGGAIIAADINGDGNLDLVLPASSNPYGPYGIQVMLGRGDGTFANARIFRSNSGVIRGVTVADFNSDGHLDVAATDGSSTLPLFLALPPAVATVTGGPIGFPAQPLGVAAAVPQKVTVTNNGGSDLRIAMATIAGPAASDFRKLQDGCSGATLGPGAICTVSLSFVPSNVSNRTAELDIVHDAAGSPQSVPLSGLGAPSPAGPYAVVVKDQGQLTDSDGARWVDVDTSKLAITVAPTADSMAILSGNADLWTANVGVNQDLGVAVSANDGPFQVVAWKESGGYGGTFSPNAAFVQAVYPMSAGTKYTVKLQWKANRSAAGATIFAGAGPLLDGMFSPISLTAQLLPANDPASQSAVSVRQSTLTGSDGVNWSDLDAGPAPITFTPSASGAALLSANADLFTGAAGYNQDLGILVTGGSYGAGQIVAWKESGGFAGTFSPNAAFVQAMIPVAASTQYTARLQWKTNKPAAGATIYAAAGAGAPYSPTRLTVQIMPANAIGARASNQQYVLVNSDGQTWSDLDTTSATPLTLSLAPTASCAVIIGGNADLWTTRSGYNQDIAISVNGTIVAWKESGGFAGTYSPNAAFVQTWAMLQGGTAYTIKLQWKTNKDARGSGASIVAGAGPWPPATPTFSPTTLTAQLIGCS